MPDLERRLAALAPDAFPPVPDVRDAVTARIAAAVSAEAGAPAKARAAAETGPAGGAAEAGPAGATPGARTAGAGGADATARRTGGGRLPGSRRRVLALALAIVLVPAAAVAAVPDARHAVLEWLGLEHVRVERTPRLPPLPSLERADLGRRVASVQEAGRQAGFAVLVPQALGAPDTVYVSEGGVVSLAYAPRPGLARDMRTGLGLLVTELRAGGVRDYVTKTAGPGTRVEPVVVDGDDGIFLSGEPHELLIAQPDGAVRALPARLAGNSLAFERGDRVIRLEGRVDRRAALTLARSIPAGEG